jgi:predicted dehydrogenase
VSATADVLGLGLIGAGRWGRNYVRTIAGMDGVRLARLASRNPESRSLAGPGCAIDADWRAMLAAGGLDGVIVAAPTALHAEMATAAIEAGLPVLVEKPMTLTVGDAEALVELADKRGAVLLVDHVHLYSAAWRALKEKTAALGPLRAVAAEAGGPGPFRTDAPMLWDWGCHDLAMCIDLVGRPPDRATAERIAARHTVDGRGETIAVELGFGGVAARLVLSNLFAEKRRRFEVVCENGRLVYDDTAAAKLTAAAPTGDVSPVPLEPGRPLERALVAFAAAIRRDRPDHADAHLGLDVARVLAGLDAALGPA